MTLAEITTLYRKARLAGSTKIGILKIEKKIIIGWELVERQADGTLVIEHIDSGEQHSIKL